MARGSCCKNVKVWSKRLNHVFLQMLPAQDEEMTIFLKIARTFEISLFFHDLSLVVVKLFPSSF